MDEKDVLNVEQQDTEEQFDDDDLALMEELGQRMAAIRKAAESGESPSEEKEPDEADPDGEEQDKKGEEKAAEEDKPESEDKGEEQPATEEEPAKRVFTEEEIEALINERVQAAVREASQKAADAVLAKERAREDSARRKLRDVELLIGKSLDELIAEYRGYQVQMLMDRDGLDEDTARRIIEAEARARQLEAMEQERQREHQVWVAKNKFAQDLAEFLNDPKADPSVKKLTAKYRQDIEDLAFDAFEKGNMISMEVARDYILGKHLPELLKEQQAELERAKAAAEQRVLKNVQERSKVKPESGSAPSVPSVPTLSREERAFLKGFASLAGLTDDDIADIAKKRAARKK